MKKIAGKIAMILILVMLANSFAGCTIFVPVATKDPTMVAVGMMLDLLSVLLIVVIMVLVEAPNETEIYLANAEHAPLTDYYSAMEILNSMPETERAAVMEKFNSMPEAKRSVLARTVASLPQTEIAASIERLNALSETELASAVQDFNALSEAQFDLLADRLNERARSLPATDYAAVAAVSP
jgi:hypothetical protein